MAHTQDLMAHTQDLMGANAPDLHLYCYYCYNQLIISCLKFSFFFIFMKISKESIKKSNFDRITEKSKVNSKGVVYH